MTSSLRLFVAPGILLVALSAGPAHEATAEIERHPIDWILCDIQAHLPAVSVSDEAETGEPLDTDESSLQYLFPTGELQRSDALANPTNWQVFRRHLASDPDGCLASSLPDRDQPFLILERLDDRPLVPLQSKWQIDGQQLIATTSANLTAAKLSTTVTLAESDAHLDPGRPRTWGADQSVNMPLAGPLFAYGQFGASTPTVDELPGVRWQSKYGVGVKLKPGIVDELQVRGGPALRSDDSGRLVRSYNGERSELFIEAVTKFGIPIIGTLNFECTSYAVPAATAGEHSQVNQDFKLARALPSGGQVHVGARYRWEELAGASPLVERTQVYLGLQLKR